MEAMLVRGGNALHGTIEISGAKNAVLPVLAATVLHGGKYVLHNCPDITDVRDAVEILQTLGGQVTRTGNVLSVDTRELCCCAIPACLMLRMRASVLFLGPLLARFGKAVLTMPGGCPLGRRPIDLHLQAMARMGAAVTLHEDRICCCAPMLHGCALCLPLPSVGATENAIMAATACHGTVTIENAAREPEVQDLIRFLQAMGAEIVGAGTDTLTITGMNTLHDADHTVMPDRIETATYLCAAAGCGGLVRLTGTDAETLLPVLEVLRQAGCEIAWSKHDIVLQSDGSLSAVERIETAPYPGLPTDAQALVMAALLRADGCSTVTETIFDRRFSHVPQFRRFGACIEIAGPTARLQGVRHLNPAHAQAGDLRAAAALLIAALQTKGESRIFGLKHLYRGYDNPEGKFTSLGADISCLQ